MILTELKTTKTKQKGGEERFCHCIELNDADEDHGLHAVHSASRIMGFMLSIVPLGSWASCCP